MGILKMNYTPQHRKKTDGKLADQFHLENDI